MRAGPSRALAAVVLAGCASRPEAAAHAPPSAPAETAGSRGEPGRTRARDGGAPAAPAALAKPEADADGGASERPRATVVKGTFPPAPIVPPAERTAAAGDGVWTPFGDARLGERAATGPFIVRTVLHPHPESRFVTVTIAAVDLSFSRMRLVPGTEDMLWAKRPPSEPSGLVPAVDRDRLLAVMNGGFQPKHGHWGLVAGPIVIAPPRDGGCTLALYRDGTVRLAPWSRLAASEPRMESLRQTPPCLLDGGAIHPALLRGDDKRWAGHAADLTTRRRSAVGLDAAGRVLFYAMGEEASPRWLAEALRLAGAETAAELDINWYWTRFLLFGTPGGEPLQVTSSLIPKMEHLKRGYVERASTRDFFYFTERK